MRLPFPERISWAGAGLYVLLMAGAQWLEHTSPQFILGCAVYTMLAVTAFNVAGGMAFLSGAWVAFNALLSLEVGLVAKVLLGEPADGNLRVPILTISVYVVGMAAVLIAVAVARTVRPRTSLTYGQVTDRNLYSSYIVCIWIGLLSIYIGFFTTAFATGGLVTQALLTFNQFNHFIPLGILLGTIYTVRSTGGRRSTSPFLLAVIVGSASLVLITYSKESFFQPVLSWALGAAMARYRLKFLQTVGFICLAVFASKIVVPYAQVGRDQVGITGLGGVGTAIYLFEHPNVIFDTYTSDQKLPSKIHFFDGQKGFLDRLNMVAIDDALIQQNALKGGPYGYEPVINGLLVTVPHWIVPGTVFLNTNNLWAHDLHIIPDDDDSTNVSFSPPADSFREGGWWGVGLVLTLVMVVSLSVLDIVWGDVRKAPLGLLMMVIESHIASEGGLGGQLYILLKIQAGVIVLGLLCKYVLPILGNVFATSGVPLLGHLGMLLSPEPDAAATEA